MGETRLSRGASSPPARRISSLFQLQQSQIVSGPGVFPGALYHLTDDEYQAEIEISPFFKQHYFALDPELEERIKEEGTQLIDLTPVDSFRSYRSPSARRRANYSVLVCRDSALHLYYRRICFDFDTGLPPTQASERR